MVKIKKIHLLKWAARPLRKGGGCVDTLRNWTLLKCISGGCRVFLRLKQKKKEGLKA